MNVQVFLGVEGDENSDSFNVTVFTPAWLASQLAAPVPDAPKDHIWGWGQLIVETWSPHVVANAIGRAIEDVEPGPDWGSVADRAGRLLPWKYDYRYDEHVNRHPGTPYP